MRDAWRTTIAALSLALVGMMVGAGIHVDSARAAGPTFGTPTAEAPLAGPSVFRTPITSDVQPAGVELLLNFPGEPFTNVIGADVSGGNGAWTAEATDAGHILPNSLLTYQFRLTDPSGSVVVGPQAQILTADDRFQWKEVDGPIVRLHWNGGDNSFGQRALDIGEKAIANASKLLGVTESGPIDFFVYDDEQAFRDALGQGTRENVAGTAIPEIRTMFAYVLPSQIDQDWVRILITHELTHLVFDTATSNIYHRPSHWLNEGIATYLSEGFSSRWQVDMAAAEADGSLIPLQGMNGVFGAGDQRFELGYAEGASAIDYFVKTYTEEKLWALVRSYSNGLSDDDAFKQAIGLDVPGFNAAWMKSLGVSVPAELGPKPGPTGPEPPDWLGLPAASPGVSAASPGASGTPTITGTRPSPRPTELPTGVPGTTNLPIDPTGLGLVGLFVLIAVIAVVVRVTRRRPTPEPPWWQGPPPQPWPPVSPPPSGSPPSVAPPLPAAPPPPPAPPWSSPPSDS